MAKIVLISNARLKQLQGTPGKSLLCDIEHHGSDNAEFFQLPGIVSIPRDGIQGTVIDCNGNNIIISAYDYKFNETLEQGETLLYSVDSAGVLKGKILINKDGEIVVNDGTDFAVRYSALETAFNTLKSEFDKHTHAYNPGPGSSTPTAPPVASLADITPAKVEEIMIP